MKLHPYSYTQLIDYATNQISGAESSLIAMHLAACPECTTTVIRVRTIRAILRDDDTEAPPPATVARAIAIFPRSNRNAQGTGALSARIKELLRRTPRFSFAPIVGALFLTLILFTGVTQVVVVHAQGTLPGDTLYPVKKTVENLQLTLAFDEPSKMEIHLAIANARIAEIATLVHQGRYAEVPETVRDFENHIYSAATDLTIIDKQNPGTDIQLAKQVDRALSKYDETLTTLSNNGPEQVKPIIERALFVSTTERALIQQILGPPITKPTSTVSAPTDTPVPATPQAAVSSPTQLSVATTAVLFVPTSQPPWTPVPFPATSVPQSPAPQGFSTALPQPATLVPPTAMPTSPTTAPVPPPTAMPLPPTSIPSTAMPTSPTAVPVPPPTAIPLPPTSIPSTPVPQTVKSTTEPPGRMHRSPPRNRDSQTAVPPAAPTAKHAPLQSVPTMIR